MRGSLGTGAGCPSWLGRVAHLCLGQAGRALLLCRGGCQVSAQLRPFRSCSPSPAVPVTAGGECSCFPSAPLQSRSWARQAPL